MNMTFDDEFLRNIAEFTVTGFIGWVMLQPEAEKMLGAFEYVGNMMHQQQSGSLSHEASQEAYDAVCWLSSIACRNGFEDMGSVFDEMARQFSHTVSSFSDYAY